MIEKHEYFNCMKRTLFGYCCLKIFTNFFMLCFYPFIADIYVDKEKKIENKEIKIKTKEEENVYWCALIAIIIIANIVFYIFGMISILKQHFCLSLTFSIMITLSVFSVFSVLGETLHASSLYFIPFLLIHFGICVLIWFFAFQVKSDNVSLQRETQV
jgi:hypothetical protein